MVEDREIERQSGEQERCESVVCRLATTLSERELPRLMFQVLAITPRPRSYRHCTYSPSVVSSSGQAATTISRE
jgi:hypothetical protein